VREDPRVDGIPKIRYRARWIDPSYHSTSLNVVLYNGNMRKGLYFFLIDGWSQDDLYQKYTSGQPGEPGQLPLVPKSTRAMTW
jgi:hypothetical protein